MGSAPSSPFYSRESSSSRTRSTRARSGEKQTCQGSHQVLFRQVTSATNCSACRPTAPCPPARSWRRRTSPPPHSSRVRDSAGGHRAHRRGTVPKSCSSGIKPNSCWEGSRAAAVFPSALPVGINGIGPEMAAPTGPFRNVGLSKAAQTHRLRKLRAPSKCRECNSYVYFQGAECEEVKLGPGEGAGGGNAPWTG